MSTSLGYELLLGITVQQNCLVYFLGLINVFIPLLLMMYFIFNLYIMCFLIYFLCPHVFCLRNTSSMTIINLFGHIGMWN